VRILDKAELEDDGEESCWEAAITAELESLKARVQEAAAHRETLLSQRRAIETYLESIDFGVLGADDGDKQEEAEIAILMNELKVAQCELDEEQQETRLQKLQSEGEIEAAFRTTILLPCEQSSCRRARRLSRLRS
jgi:septal ring factor EnvC (AmiA/AmiB activator)